MKNFAARALALSIPALGLVAVPAHAVGVDYSTLTSAVDFSTTTSAILAVGALAVTLALAVTGVRKILRMVRGA